MIAPSAAVRLHVTRGLTFLRQSAPTARLWVLACYYNPLGIRVLAPCSDLPDKVTTDWRAPDYIDAYNAISKLAVQELGAVHYIDNNVDILGPVWDGAADWNHPSSQVFRALAAKLFARISHKEEHHMVRGPR